MNIQIQPSIKSIPQRSQKYAELDEQIQRLGDEIMPIKVYTYRDYKRTWDHIKAKFPGAAVKLQEGFLYVWWESNKNLQNWRNQ